LLLAAGRGTRLQAAVPKAYLTLRGAPLLLHSAARLLAAVPPEDTAEVFVLAQPEDRQAHLAPHLATLAKLAGGPERAHVVDGGATRQESMERGLQATPEDAGLIVVHDAARALVPVERTRDCIRAAQSTGAALLAIPATDTLKRVQNGHVVETLDRSAIWYAQTPQIARRELFLRACAHARKTGFAVTDDASLLEHAGIDVAVVDGSTGNLKITHPDDIPLAEALLERDPSPLP